MESENYGLLPKHAGVRFIGFKSFGIPPGRAGLLLRKKKKHFYDETLISRATLFSCKKIESDSMIRGPL